MADEKTTTKEALKLFSDGYKWMIEQQGQGVNTPLPRQLKQIIKLYFKKDGVEAVASIEREALNKKGITPSLIRTKSIDQPKKLSSDRRLERIALRETGQEDGSNTKAAVSRMKRLANRGIFGTPTLKTELEESESVAAGEQPEKQPRARKSTAGATIEVQPLNTTEIQLIGEMGAKEIVDAYGADRVLATLQAFNDPDIVLTGSPKQLANRLKFRIYPQPGQ